MCAKKGISAIKLLSCVLMFLVLAALVACPLNSESESGDEVKSNPTPAAKPPKVDNAKDQDEEEGVSKTFWALNLTTSIFYQLTADLLAEGSYCKVWVEQESQKYCDSSTAQKIAAEYDNKIYGEMLNAFNVIPEGTQVFNDPYVDNIMEAADWLADGDGKLCILMLDIKDGYSQHGSFTAGYFYSIDLLKNDPANPNIHSNETDMIYLDTYPAEPGGTVSYQTLSHEMQHLMNFTTSLAIRSSVNSIKRMDTWIDEGLSSAAEYIYLGTHVSQNYEWFNTDSMGTIALGNNFLVWGNIDNDSILDDYATVYLFFQWLRLQSGGEIGIYKDIMMSQYNDYYAVVQAAYGKIDWFKNNVGSPLIEYNKGDPEHLKLLWRTLFEPWLAANYINSSNGKYGYNNDTILKKIQARTAPNGTTSLKLLPGEAVYSKTNNDGNTSNYIEGSGSNIKYAGLKKNDSSVSSDNTYNSGALLTYNSNTVNSYSSYSELNSLKETGNLTGEADKVKIAANSLSIAGTDTAKPVRIDARDMLTRNGLANEALNTALMLQNAAFNMMTGVE